MAQYIIPKNNTELATVVKYAGLGNVRIVNALSNPYVIPKTEKDGKDATAKGKQGNPGMDAIAEKKPDKAKGTQAITINISINKLIESFKVETTNIQESTAKIKELVANTLLSAVNDASITADI